jgi:hypothetical protein
MTIRRRATTKLAAALVAGALVLGFIGAPGVQAAVVNVSYVVVDGSEMNIGDTVFPLFDPANPNSSGIVGTYDDVTGEFEGEFISPERRTTQRVEAPLAGNIDLVIATESVSSQGTIDPVTGEVAVTNVIDIVMTFEQLVPDSGVPPFIALNVACTLAGVELELTSEPPGFPPTAPGEPFAIAGEGFEVPEPTCEGTIPGVDPNIVTLVRDGLIDNLGLPTTDTSIYLEFAPGTPTPPAPLPPLQVPETTTSTTVAPVTAPAQAVRATPRVTG